MSKQMIISVMSKDRPGVIADITGAIYQLNGDLADLNQSILFGYLTMILVASFDDSVIPEDVIAKISHIKTGTKFEIIVKELDVPIDTRKVQPPQDTYIVTAQGKNQSGLVYSISQFCYDHNINILDLATKLSDDQYVMVLQLDLNNVESVEQLQQDLEDFSTQSGLNVTMQHNDIFQATNEVTLHAHTA